MTFEMGPETRQVQGTWDASTYKYRMDGTGVHLLAQAMKEKKIKGIRCSECGTVYVPGPTYCKKCFVDIDEIVEVKDTGTVMSYTVEMADVRGNPRDEFLILLVRKLRAELRLAGVQGGHAGEGGMGRRARGQDDRYRPLRGHPGIARKNSLIEMIEGGPRGPPSTYTSLPLRRFIS
jgi:uncharacterized OB-fold protein